MKKINLKMGISLIVLTITIVVMLILATTVILSITDTNIIEKTTKIVTDKNIKTLQTEANVAINDLIASRNDDFDDKDIVDKMKENGVDKELLDNVTVEYLNGKVKITRNSVAETSDGYHIKNANEYIEIVKRVNLSNDFFAGKTIIIDNDIDFGSTTVPIMTEFRGILDGNGKTLTVNAYSNCEATYNIMDENKDTMTIGLVSYLNTSGKVQNLRVKSSEQNQINLTVSNPNFDVLAISSIVGINNGEITGCSSNTLIKVSKNCSIADDSMYAIGNIVGTNIRNINNSYNSGNIDAVTTFVGGIAGANIESTAIIQRCYNSGLIKGSKEVGGIAGGSLFGARIENVYNKGTVTAYVRDGGIDCSGITGYILEGATINNSYNVGEIEKPIGATGNQKGYQITFVEEDIPRLVQSCYYTAAYQTEGSNMTDDVIQKTVEEFTNGTVLSLLNAQSNVWKTGDDNYPVLNWQ